MAASLIVSLVGAWVPRHRDRRVPARGRLLGLYSPHPARLMVEAVERSVGAR